MKFNQRLFEGPLIQRYKRFFADVEHAGEKITIHVPNTGSLKGVIETTPDAVQRCWYSLHHDPIKKLKGTLEAVQTIDGSWVGVNTSHPNRVVTEAIQSGLLSGQAFFEEWSPYTFYRPEYKINKESRLDGVFLRRPQDLEDPNSKKHFIEIKNTTYVGPHDLGKMAQFPDSVTTRGQKHLIEMMKLMDEGHTCELIFAVQRNDVSHFSTAHELDPVYARLLTKAFRKGLIVSPILMHIDQNEVYLTAKKLTFHINE